MAHKAETYQLARQFPAEKMSCLQKLVRLCEYYGLKMCSRTGYISKLKELINVEIVFII